VPVAVVAQGALTCPQNRVLLSQVQKSAVQTITNAQQRYLDAFAALYEAAGELNAGDPMSYARSREIHMACLLGHSVADTYSGADAFESDGTPVEYKSTIGNNITATYNGISVQPTWEDQEEYLCEHKIGCYPRHYYARYEGANVAEIWVMDSDTVLSILLPKCQKQYSTKRNGNAKDPRIGVTISTKEIKENGRRLI
tara:strand:+ start:390 stop:983 length:594 start_codon:yes stop_codon:yes gene_type:complete